MTSVLQRISRAASRRNAPSPARSVAPVLVSLLALSCAAVGSGIVDGVHNNREKLADAVRPVSRAAVEEAGRAFQDSVQPKLGTAVATVADSLRPQLRTILAGLLDTLEFRAGRLEDSLATWIAGSADTAVQRLLAHNVRLVRDSIDRALGVWLGTVSASLESELWPGAARAADEIAARTLDTLAATVDSTGVLGRAIVGLGDRVVRQAIQAIREETQRATPWWVWLGLGLFVAVVLAIIGLFAIAARRELARGKTSLRIVTRAIQEANDTRLAARVKSLASDQGVEPWLWSFLTRERLLLQTEGEK